MYAHIFVDIHAQTRRGNSCGSVSVSQAVVLRTAWQFFSGKHNVPLALIEEERVVSHLRKNGYLILVNSPREACPGTKCLYVTDSPT